MQMCRAFYVCRVPHPENARHGFLKRETARRRRGPGCGIAFFFFLNYLKRGFANFTEAVLRFREIRETVSSRCLCASSEAGGEVLFIARESLLLNGRSHNKIGGSILILCLWVIFLLALLAVAVGASLEGRLALARKMEQRTLGACAARVGVARSLALLHQDTNAWDAMTEPWAGNPALFSNVTCAAGTYSVYYPVDRAAGGQGTNYGLRDEQSRIDLNLARVELLVSLFEEAGLGAEAAARLADNLATARTRPAENSPGVGVKTGWADSRLERGPLESVEEARWIAGMTAGVFDTIRSHVTVHGGYRVNLNTADAMVLKVLAKRAGGREGGGGESLTRKILQFRERSGIFKSYLGAGLAEALGPEARLTEDERRRLYGMAPFITVVSDHFRGHVEGASRKQAGETRLIDFGWDRKHRKFEFWHEN